MWLYVPCLFAPASPESTSGCGLPLYFGLGENAKWGRFEAWRYIAAVQRQVDERRAA